MDLEIYFGEIDDLIILEVFPSDEKIEQFNETYANELVNLLSWELIEVSKAQLKFRLNFTNPEAITSDDTVNIYLEFGDFDY